MWFNSWIITNFIIIIILGGSIGFVRSEVGKCLHDFFFDQKE